MFFVYLAAVVVFMVVLSVFFTKATVRIMGKLGGETIYKLHESAEFILNTGLIPPFWREKAEGKLRSARENNSPQESIAKIEGQVKRRYLKQMKKLLHFARNSSTVTDEEARAILVAGLEKARDRWLTSSLSDMTGV